MLFYRCLSFSLPSLWRAILDQQLHQRQSFDPIFLILEKGEEETTSSILPPDPNFLDRGKDYIPARYVYVSRDERQSLSRARVRGCEARFT